VLGKLLPAASTPPSSPSPLLSLAIACWPLWAKVMVPQPPLRFYAAHSARTTIVPLDHMASYQKGTQQHASQGP
jgi:hypothetical protein